MIVVLLLGVLVVVAIQFPRQTTALFFSVNISPVGIDVKDEFPDRQTDTQTIAIVTAANLFLESLDEQQKDAATYAFSDNAQRSNWSNFPEGMIPRGGLKMGTLTEDQLAKLNALLAVIMSEKGYENIEYQLAAERTFPTNHLTNKYGVDHFYVAFLGEPSEKQPWMFQFGGHHLGINVTIYGPDATFSPMLTGGQPLYIQYQGNEIFITEEETAAAQAFMSSLTKDQQNTAIRSHEPINLLLGPGKYGTVIAPEGIKGSDLTEAQKQLLITLINTRLGFINKDDHKAKMETVIAELDDTYFGWWGPQGKLGFAYFRITGPSVIIEYAPQNDAGDLRTEHAHSMFRNPLNDYGSAWIEQKQQ
ncbi:MAG: DUF3500 domain-containing protein [Rhodobacteraceae bacterium]|nr:DUF3500 domain-containing protein [Paracoccaceae bacterium]MDE2739592.1 DUF3500 domain-containing protein [Paracoccaceae bacterium]MXZ51327.1 DUF3500 domain-containing protein [Paracoccaceae bacterium]MYF45421.1 DUF3500 domain-containing protein [Paracoccaceae bacterium]MYI90649.1 DUF3500 domain-containing protein [Paracoccaceae bacterium]